MTAPAVLPNFEEAVARHRAGDVGSALEVYRQLLCHHVSDGLLLQLIGVALHQQGRAAEALRWLGRAMLMLGPQPLLLHHAGEAAGASGDVMRAVVAHRSAVAGQPDLVKVASRWPCCCARPVLAKRRVATGALPWRRIRRCRAR